MLRINGLGHLQRRSSIRRHHSRCVGELARKQAPSTYSASGRAQLQHKERAHHWPSAAPCSPFVEGAVSHQALRFLSREKEPIASEYAFEMGKRALGGRCSKVPRGRHLPRALRRKIPISRRFPNCAREVVAARRFGEKSKPLNHENPAPISPVYEVARCSERHWLKFSRAPQAAKANSAIVMPAHQQNRDKAGLGIANDRHFCWIVEDQRRRTQRHRFDQGIFCSSIVFAVEQLGPPPEPAPRRIGGVSHEPDTEVGVTHGSRASSHCCTLLRPKRKHANRHRPPRRSHRKIPRIRRKSTVPR